MLNLTELGVEVFIKKARFVTPFWDNYDLIIWQKNNNGFTSVNGMFKKDAWGTAERISVDSDGIWKLPVKHVRNFK